MVMASDLEKLAGDPDSPLFCEVARLGNKQLHRIRKLASEELWSSVESIHDMRVATRRLRELLKIQLEVEKSKPLKKTHRFARDLGRRLGGVRAGEVLIQGLKELGPGVPIRVLALSASMQRRKELQRLASLLRSDEFDVWVDRAEGEFEKPNARGPTVEEAAAALIERSRAKVQAHCDVQPDDEFGRLHRLRIDAKHLRYRLEFFSKVPDLQAARAIKQLTELQDHLGELHDKILLVDQIESALDAEFEWTRDERSFLSDIQRPLREQTCKMREESPSKWAFAFESHFLEQDT